MISLFLFSSRLQIHHVVVATLLCLDSVFAEFITTFGVGHGADGDTEQDSGSTTATTDIFCRRKGKGKRSRDESLPCAVFEEHITSSPTAVLPIEPVKPDESFPIENDSRPQPQQTPTPSSPSDERPGPSTFPSPDIQSVPSAETQINPPSSSNKESPSPAVAPNTSTAKPSSANILDPTNNSEGSPSTVCIQTGGSSEPACIPTIPVSPPPTALHEVVEPTPTPSALRELLRPFPTYQPSTLPGSTRSPSSPPPTITAPGECITVNGEYGSLQGGERRIVSFLYSVELDRDVRLEEYQTNVVPSVEVTLNDYLVPVLFDVECNNTSEGSSRRRLVRMDTRRRRLSTTTGMSSLPVDTVYENVDCEGIFCFAMLGQVTLFFDTNSTDNGRKDMVLRDALSAAMGAGRFDNDPPIIRVRYIADDTDSDRGANTAGPTSVNETNASTNGGPPVGLWVGLSLGLLGAVVMLCWCFGRSTALPSWLRQRRRAGTVSYIQHPSPEPSVVLVPSEKEPGSNSSDLEKNELKSTEMTKMLPQSMDSPMASYSLPLSSDSDSQDTPQPSDPLFSEGDTTTLDSNNGSLVSSVDGARLYHQLPQPAPNGEEEGDSDLHNNSRLNAIAWRDPEDASFSRPSTEYAQIRSNFDTSADAASISAAGWIISSSDESSQTMESRILRIAGPIPSNRSARSTTLQRITEGEEAGDGIVATPPNDRRERAFEHVRRHNNTAAAAASSSLDTTSSDEEL